MTIAIERKTTRSLDGHRKIGMLRGYGFQVTEGEGTEKKGKREEEGKK